VDRRARLLGAAVTAWSFVLAAAFTWIPGYWWDEAATVLMAGKPWEDFLATMRDADAVHAAYYLLMRGWSEPFGLGTLSTRMLSALAVAGTSLVLFHLGRSSLSVRVGVIAGVLYPLVPAVVWAAGEARSFALSALAAALVLLALVRALDRPGEMWRWVVMALAIVVMGWTFLFALLGLPGALLLVTRDQWRRHWRAILAAVGAGLAGTAPLVWFAAGQRGQVSWIPEIGTRDMFWTIAVNQYFRDELSFALAFWPALAVGGLLAWRARGDHRRPLVAYAASIAVPTLALALSGPVLGTPLYVVRYLLFTAPALAMIGAIALSRLSVPLLAALMGAFLVFGAGPSLESRLDPLSKSSWLFAADTLGTRSEPGDAMVAFSVHLTGARAIHPEELGSMPLLNETVGPEEAAAGIIPSDGGSLTDLVVPSDVKRIWYLSDSHSRYLGRSDIEADLALLARQGFAPVWSSDPEGFQSLVIVLLERR